VPSGWNHDPSDAVANVIRTQIAQGTGALAWQRITASMLADAAYQAAAAMLRQSASVIRR